MSRRFLILAEGQLQELEAKTTLCAIRYLPDEVAAIIDSTRAGRTAQAVLGFGGDIPIVGDLTAGLQHEPTGLLIGIAPAGGRLPEPWRQLCLEAARAGLDLWSGMHQPLAADPPIAEAAAEAGVEIHDLRCPPHDLPIAAGRARDVEPLVLLTVGSDCAVGKLTTALEIVAGLQAGGIRAELVPTGQTGILIAGWGVAVDAVVSDFTAGAAERLVLEGAARGADVLVVEGQGALSHPGYSGVTLGLLHGTLPDAMVLCHQPGRASHCGDDNAWMPLPPLASVVDMYERAASWIRPGSSVLSVSLNTRGLSEADARGVIRAAAAETGLPATDPVRYGVRALVGPVRDLLDVA